MFDSYFVYILQSTSRRALYIGFTKCLISRVIEHRARRHPNSFTAKYRTWRLVYYEEFGDSAAAFARERQLKGWSRAKKEWLITVSIHAGRTWFQNGKRSTAWNFASRDE